MVDVIQGIIFVKLQFRDNAQLMSDPGPELSPYCRSMFDNIFHQPCFIRSSKQTQVDPGQVQIRRYVNFGNRDHGCVDNEAQIPLKDFPQLMLQ